MVRLRAVLPLHTFVARHFRNPRVREAFSFHSLFIGGDPFRVPAIYGALVYLQLLDGGWYTDGGVYALVEAMARPLDVRCDARVEAIETGGRRRPRRAAGGRGADRGRRRRVQRRRAAHARAARPPRAPAPAAAHDVRVPALPGLRPRASTSCCTTRCWSGTGTATSSATSPAAAACRRRYSTYVHAPARTEAAMATPGGDSLAVLLPVPNLRAGIDWDRAADGLRDAVVRDMETTFGLTGLDASRAGGAPDGAAGLRVAVRGRGRQRVRGRADAAPVRVLPGAEPRARRARRSTTSAAGRTRAPASRAC